MCRTITDTRKIKTLIAPSFYILHNDIKQNLHTHYILKGGRGSTKSSFISVEIVLGIMQDKDANGVVMRKVASTLKDSVISQIKWAIGVLGVEDSWKTSSSTEFTYLPTGQKILFKGCDDVQKLKSIKFPGGFCKFVWFEECDEFSDKEEFLSVVQSLLRGGQNYKVFYSFNPPKSKYNFMNKMAEEQRDDMIIHHSTYLNVPKKWLGEQFFKEAEILKSQNPLLYDNLYLGKITNTEGQIFNNFEITDKVINTDIKFLGQDFGYNHYNVILELGFLDDAIFVSKEYAVRGLDTNEIISGAEGKFDKSLVMWCDSAEPDRIKMWQKAGYRASGVKKESKSINGQIDYLLSKKIIINRDCKRLIEEIRDYHWIKDKKTGEYTDIPAPVNDDAIAALRYGVEYMRKAGK